MNRKISTIMASLLITLSLHAQTQGSKLAGDTRVFQIDRRIDVQNVRFKNRYGIELAAHLYLPIGFDPGKKYAVLVVSGPFGAVKEQSSGLYAQMMAQHGFVAIAFDPSFCGESGQNMTVHNVASPDIFSEDFSSAVDFAGMLGYVDRERIGAIGICGLSGMALTAAGADTRIKAVATVVMYDMHRSMSEGIGYTYTPAQKEQVKRYLSEQRWKDAESGSHAVGPHEVGIATDGSLLNQPLGQLPDELPAGTDPVTLAFFNYYAKRARHPRAINFVTNWTATTPMSFFEFPLMTNIKEISPRPILIVTGERAHSRYFAEDAYKAANEPKEIIVVPGADHVDLYDQLDKIPTGKIVDFFNSNLK